MQNLFDRIKVPHEELEHIVNEKLDMIREESQRKKRSRLLGGFTAAAACMAGLIVFSFSNPVLAAQLPLIGHLFAQVEDKQPYYRDIDTEKVQAVPETEGTENTVNGLKISISEIYCSTEAMYMTVLIESEEGFPEYLLERDSGSVDFFMINAEQTFDFADTPLVFPLQFNGEYIDGHTFAGSTQVDFSLGYGSDTVSWSFPDTVPEAFHWNMNITDIYAYSDILQDGSYETYTADGPWSFEADVTAHQVEKVVKEVNDYSPNGIGITTAEKGEYEILLNYDYDESKAEYDVESIQSVILDADGKYMPDKAGMLPIGDFNVSRIDVYYLPADSEDDWAAIQKKLAAGEPADFIKELAVHHTEIDFGS